MIPSPCGVPRSSTAWAIAIPIQTTPNVVNAIPAVTVTPSRAGIAIASRNITGRNATAASSTWRSSPSCAATREPDQRREARELDRPHALVHPEQLVQAQRCPSASAPAANTQPP